MWLSILMLSSGYLLAHPELYRFSTPMECDDQHHHSPEYVVNEANQLLAMYLQKISHLATVLSPEELQPLLLSHVVEMSRAIQAGPAYPAEVLYPEEEL